MLTKPEQRTVSTPRGATSEVALGKEVTWTSAFATVPPPTLMRPALAPW